MKLLIFGGNGYIGKQIINHINGENIEFYLSKNRISPENLDSIKTELKDISPTNILLLIGRTHGEGYNTIDYLEQKDKLKINVNDNLYAPVLMTTLCQTEFPNIHVTYIGTGCIFNYSEFKTGSMYTEDSIPDFFGSSYSVVKGFTDQLLKNLKVLNLRIRMPISSIPDDRNFITKITKYEKICNMNNSMTILDDFIPIFVDMMKRKMNGTYNCTNEGYIDHNTILSLYKSIVDPNKNWVNFTLEEQNNILLSKRSNNILDVSKLSQHYKIPNINDSIINVLNKYKTQISEFKD
jgi:dTDP-4-dehydrorhamnose reductase